MLTNEFNQKCIGPTQIKLKNFIEGHSTLGKLDRKIDYYKNL